jgi:peptidoglycan/xylan/chitin deacetylase (PgdA/CDA1 family)
MPVSKKMKFNLVSSCLLILAFLYPLVTCAKDVPFEVLPWNGYKAAISLTYDDGDPIHLDLAIPEMSKRGLRGTFYLISGKLDRVGDWKKVTLSGQEIGNHTITHRHTSELKPEDEKAEVVDAKEKLQSLFGVPVLTLAYPFVEISPGLRKWVEAENFCARGGGGNFYLTPDMDPDWFNLPSQATMTAFAYETYKGWVDQNLSTGAWTVLMIHAIEGSSWWQPIPKETYLKLLDYLVENKKTLWTAPFGEVAAYWRAEKILEKAEPQKEGAKTFVRWEKPANFPKGVKVKLNIQGDKLQVSQSGKDLKPADKDIYDISFDAGELTLKNAAWKPAAARASVAPIEAKAPVIDAGSVVSAPSKDVLKVDDFESGAPAYGGSWWAGCDTNGITKLSPVPFSTLTDGSPQSPGHCAGMKGHMGPVKEPWPWAVLSLGLDSGGKPVDLSSYQAIRFYTQGDGKTHVVALNKAAVTDYCDYQSDFVSPSAWTRVTIPFSDFAQANWGKQVENTFNDVMKLTFSPGAGDPDFDFKVDDLEFLKEIPALGKAGDSMGKDTTAKDSLTFTWKASGPLVAPIPDADHPIVSVKDPTLVKFEDQWRLIATTADTKGSWSMVDLKFPDWPKAVSAKPYYMDANLNLRGYHCAPQVFYFTPQKKWYLIFQSGQPQYSTTDDINKPESWSRPQDFFNGVPESVVDKSWLDFWVIGDTKYVYLFFTGDNGRFYRSRTAVKDFPEKMSEPVVVMQAYNPGDLYEGSATYYLKGMNKYLTLIEAMSSSGPRYYKAFTSDSLDGKWEPLADSWQNPFAGINNVTFEDGVKPWTKDISHAELIRDRYDEMMTVDPDHLQLLFQGRDPASDKLQYSQLPYRLGLLTLEKWNKK